MKTVVFGTDGIRGPAGTWPVTVEVGHAVGVAAFKLANAQGGRRVVVARDPRPSSPALADAVARGVTSAGGVALDADVVPTAAVGIAVADGAADGGVMVTASHNPEADNGFKLLGRGGVKLDEAACAAVEAWIAQALEASGSPGGPPLPVPQVADAWRQRVEAGVGPLPLLGKKLAIDLANGAAIAALPWLADWLGAELVVIGAGGAVNDGCGSEHLEALTQAVRDQGCQGGLAMDGDADRCRLVDETGAVIPGDAVTWRLAVDRKVDAVAVTVMSNAGLEACLPGVRVVRTAVGDRHVARAMVEQGIFLGAEESGHVLFADHPAGDGLLAGVRALCAAWRAEDTLSAAFRGFTPLPRRVGKVRVARRPPLEDVGPLQAVMTEAAHRLGPSGRTFLRYSGTEPVLRILVEGRPEDEVERALAALVEAARGALT